MESTNNQPAPTAEPSNVSACERDPLKRLMLMRLGKLTGGESDQYVEKIYADHLQQLESKAIADEQERKRTFSEMYLAGLRGRLKDAGLDPAGMTEREMVEKLTGVQQESLRKKEEAQRAAREIEKRKRAERLFAASGATPLHTENLNAIDAGQNARWIETRDLLVQQAQYAKGYLIALLGIRGVGKTQLAMSVIHGCCRQLMTCRYVKAADLFRDVRRAYVPPARGQAGVSEADVVASWISFDLLVIDELHQRGGTPAEDNILTNIIDHRYDRNLCTILVANLSPEDFADNVGDSVVSRIHEKGEAIACDWPSYRRPGTWRQADDARRRVPSGAQARRRDEPTLAELIIRQQQMNGDCGGE